MNWIAGAIKLTGRAVTRLIRFEEVQPNKLKLQLSSTKGASFTLAG